MSGVTFEYMEKYLRDLIPDRNDELKELEDFAKENKVPIIQKEGAKFLEFMVSMNKPKKILELGTAIGYSSILMNKACGGECHITTIERDDNMINYAKENIKKFGLEEKKKSFPFLEFNMFIYAKNGKFVISNIEKAYEGLTYNKLLRDKKVDKSYLVNINVCKNCGNFAVEVEELEV